MFLISVSRVFSPVLCSLCSGSLCVWLSFLDALVFPSTVISLLCFICIICHTCVWLLLCLCVEFSSLLVHCRLWFAVHVFLHAPYCMAFWVLNPLLCVTKCKFFSYLVLGFLRSFCFWNFVFCLCPWTFEFLFNKLFKLNLHLGPPTLLFLVKLGLT